MRPPTLLIHHRQTGGALKEGLKSETPAKADGSADRKTHSRTRTRATAGLSPRSSVNCKASQTAMRVISLAGCPPSEEEDVCDAPWMCEWTMVTPLMMWLCQNMVAFT